MKALKEYTLCQFICTLFINLITCVVDWNIIRSLYHVLCSLNDSNNSMYQTSSVAVAASFLSKFNSVQVHYLFIREEMIYGLFFFVYFKITLGRKQ